MELKIKTDPSRFFRQLLEILDFTPKYIILSNREKDVFAEILMYSWIYKDVAKEERWIIITSSDIREKMRVKLGMSKEGLNNIFTALRRKKLITFTGVSEDYLMTPDSILTIKFYQDADR